MLRQIPILEPSKQPLRQPLVQPFQPDPSCVLWLLPQRDSKWYDYSGNENHGVIHNAVWKSSRAGVGMYFNGTTAFVNCGSNSSLNLTGELTVRTWVKYISTGSTQYLVGKQLIRYFLIIRSSNKPAFYVGGDGSDVNGAQSSVALTSNQWYHIVGTHGGAGGSMFTKIYVNGVYRGAAETPNDSSSSIEKTRIGSYLGTSGYFKGAVNEAQIYNRALSAEEIASIWRVERSWYGV